MPRPESAGSSGSSSLLRRTQGLNAQFKEVMVENELLAHENALFQSALNRLLATSEEEGMDVSDILRGVSESGTRGSNGSTNNNSGNDESTGEQLSQAQKFALAQQELAALEREKTQIEHKGQKDVADLVAMLGETKMRVEELRKDAYEFRRDILLGAEDSRTRKTDADKFVRFWEERLRAKEQLVEKYRMKNNAVKSSIAKADAQLKQKEEQGDSLNSIDFHQLKIENAQFNQKIKERNAELLALKMTTGKTVQRLNTAKKSLGDVTSQIGRLQHEIKERKETLQKLTVELRSAEDELEVERSRNDTMKAQISSAEIPQIMDYVQQKARQTQLETTVRSWKRKIEIAEMALHRAKAAARKAATAVM